MKLSLRDAAGAALRLPVVGLGYLGWHAIKLLSRFESGQEQLVKAYPYAVDVLDAMELDRYRSPPQGKEKIDSLETLLMAGIDIKITPAGEVKVIEINGYQSGMKGFEEAGVPFEPYMPHDVAHPPAIDAGGEDEANPCERAVESYLMGFGSMPLHFIAGLLMNGDAVKPFPLIDGIDWIEPYLRHRLVQPAWVPADLKEGMAMDPGWYDRYGRMARFIDGIEHVFEDKYATDALFANCRSFKAQSRVLSQESIEGLLSSGNVGYAVLKPRRGMQGDGIEIVEARKLRGWKRFEEDYIIEPFVVSKPISAERDGLSHDGCMRYIICCHESKKGKFAIRHVGGYWRLAPRAMADVGSIGAMRANLAKGAWPQRVSREDLVRAGTAVEEFFPLIYRAFKDSWQDDPAGGA